MVRLGPKTATPACVNVSDEYLRGRHCGGLCRLRTAEALVVIGLLGAQVADLNSRVGTPDAVVATMACPRSCRPLF